MEKIIGLRGCLGNSHYPWKFDHTFLCFKTATFFVGVSEVSGEFKMAAVFKCFQPIN